MAVNKYWRVKVTHHDSGGNVTEHDGMTSGMGNAEQYASWLRSRDFKGQNVDLEVHEVTADDVDMEKYPLAAHVHGQPNQLLTNAAGKSVNAQTHEIIEDHETTEEAEARLHMERTDARQRTETKAAAQSPSAKHPAPAVEGDMSHIIEDDPAHGAS